MVAPGFREILTVETRRLDKKKIARESGRSVKANGANLGYFLSAGQGVPWSMTVTGPMPL